MKFLKAFLYAALGSIVANLIILYVCKPFVLNPAMPLHALSLGPVAALTFIGTIGATMVYALLRAFMKEPNMTFLWIAIIVLLLSFIPDYEVIGMTTGPFAGGTVASALTLALMHIVAAIIVFWSLTRLWGPKGMMSRSAI